MNDNNKQNGVKTYLNNEKPYWFNIPNVLTIFRMVLIPVFVWAFYEFPERRFIALVIFGVASLTDCLDGYLARKLNQITSFGKLMDPLADKLMVITMLVCLAEQGSITGEPGLYNWLIPAIIAAKEIYMVIGSLYMLSKNVVVKSNIVGKLATLLFILSIMIIFPYHAVEWLLSFGRLLLAISVVMSLIAMACYTLESVKVLSEQHKDTPKEADDVP